MLLIAWFRSRLSRAKELVAAGVLVHGEQLEDSPLMVIFLTWGPVFLIVVLWVYFMRIYARREN